ncbi:MAG TPA: DNA glycosylase [Puia sp.]
MPDEKRIVIPFPADFSFRECLWFLDRGYDDCMHTVKGNAILKALRVEGQAMLIRLTADKDRLQVEILQGGDMAGRHVRAESSPEEFIKNYLIGWLDLERDLTPFYRLLDKDKRLSYMSAAFRGLRLIGIVDLFEALSWSIIGQQINLTFAHKLKRRLVEKYGEKGVFEGQAYYLFPACEVLAGVTVAELRAMQFSQSKAAYLIGLASSFAKGELSREMLLGLPDLESRQKALTALKGIGIWTANYTLMKTLREPSSIPHGDTGLLTALANHAIIKERSEVEKINRFFSKYKGWESYLVFYLWRSLAPAAPS